MRILLLTHRLPYAPNRGDRIRAYHLLRLLSQTHDVHLVSLIHNDDEMGHLNDLKDTVASIRGVRLRRFRNVVSAAIAWPGRRPLTHVLLHGPRMRSVLRQCINSAPPDVVLAYCTGVARYALEPPLSGLPLVLDMVDVDSEKWTALAQTSTAPAKWIYQREARTLRQFERLAVERARATVVVSERERVVLDRISPGNGAVVVQNGVDFASFAPPTAGHSEPRVVFCGVFDYGPNEAGAIWMASAVWPLVTRLVPDAQLSLVGMNPSPAVRELGANPSIHVTGAVPDVRPYLWQSAISIAPIWLARGVQNKVLEATAAGLPCVVTPAVFDGLPSQVRPAVVVANDAGSFAEAMVSLLREGPESRRRIAGRADLSQLSWSTQLLPFLDLVGAAAKKASGPNT